jgi:transcriptional regulator with XRE-family HTH domain
MPPQRQTTIARRRLGSELRRLREARGLTVDQVAKAVHLSASTISRFENAQVRIRRGDVREILEVLEVRNEETDRLLQLALEALQESWWHRSFADLPLHYADFEVAAVATLHYHPVLVPGLLQTEAYARAVFQALSPGLDPPDVQRRVAFRMQRQARFLKEGSLALHAVLDEAGLLRPIGGPGVLRDQLLRLIELYKEDNVELQLLPLAAGAHAGLDGAFAIYEFSDYHDIVYLEGTVSDFRFERDEEVERYKRLFAALSGQALAAHETASALERIIAQIPATSDD